ncbi:hypothetical protein EDB19DRAFT_1837093 [Suillus lakei]|nr:hypothetical protein EDB19DRAFT_1837093 [Suillus lakei]
MPPRKGKKKADDDGAVAITTPTTGSDPNAFKLDTRPVQPVVPTDDPAAKIQHLDAAVEKAKIGIGRMNVLKLNNALTFGVYNDRQEKSSEINKMVTSFEIHGIQAFSEINALPIIIQRSRLSPDQTFDGDWNQRETLMKSYLDDETTYSKRLKQLEDLKVHTDAHVEEHAMVRNQLAEVKGRISNDGEWGVILYDHELILDAWIPTTCVHAGASAQQIIGLFFGHMSQEKLNTIVNHSIGGMSTSGVGNGTPGVQKTFQGPGGGTATDCHCVWGAHYIIMTATACTMPPHTSGTLRLPTPQHTHHLNDPTHKWHSETATPQHTHHISIPPKNDPTPQWHSETAIHSATIHY